MVSILLFMVFLKGKSSAIIYSRWVCFWNYSTHKKLKDIYKKEVF